MLGSRWRIRNRAIFIVVCGYFNRGDRNAAGSANLPSQSFVRNRRPRLLPVPFADCGLNLVPLGQVRLFWPWPRLLRPEAAGLPARSPPLLAAIMISSAGGLGEDLAAFGILPSLAVLDIFAHLL